MASLYPSHIPPHAAHPTTGDFLVVEAPPLGRLVAVRRGFRKGQVLARFDGVTSAYVTQHTLQKGPGLHLLDPYFIGLLAHACAPSARLDMAAQLVIAVRDLAAGDLVSVDYDLTEDALFAPFQCHCGAPACRGRIVGRALTAPPPV